MMSGSIYEKLARARAKKPPVHITYNVETNGAREQKELPFVVGVMGDFSGDPTKKLSPLAERKFVSIDSDNFNEVMERMAPGLNLQVKNKLQDDGSELPVSLTFTSMNDFSPGRIIDQVPALKTLLETRNKLSELLNKPSLSEDLEALLEKILQDKTQLAALMAELNATAGKEG